MGVFAVGIEPPAIPVAAFVRSGNCQLPRCGVKTKTMAIRNFRILIERLFVIRLLKDDLALAGRAARYHHDETGRMEVNFVHKAVRRCAVPQGVGPVPRLEVEQEDSRRPLHGSTVLGNGSSDRERFASVVEGQSSNSANIL